MFDLAFILAQQAPQLSGAYDWLMLASRILHILGAIILVGGVFYLRTVVVPLPFREGRGEGSTAPADQFFGGPRATWAKWVGIATLVLLATGFWNYFQLLGNYELASSYHMIAGMKMLAGIALFFLAALLAGRTSVAESLRQKWRLWLNVCLIIGVITVVLGSVLRTYPRIEKLDASSGPTLIAP